MGVIYTPGHTDDSYSSLMQDRVFTGDTLMIRGTGRTDFQNSDPRAQYESLFGSLWRQPEETLVFPGAAPCRPPRPPSRRSTGEKPGRGGRQGQGRGNRVIA